MHRLLVTLTLLLLPVLAGCAGQAIPFTGNTAGGGVVAHESRLLGIAIPRGMDFYPEHSQIEGADGMEILRGTASPALCASSVSNALQDAGWQGRLGYATERRALHVFEKQGRLAVINIEPQSGFTLMIIYTSSNPPQGMPIPVRKKSDFSFGFGFGQSSSRTSEPADGPAQGGIPVQEEGTGGLSTAPLDSSGPASSGDGGTFEERDL